MNAFLIIIIVYEGQKVDWFDLRSSKNISPKVAGQQIDNSDYTKQSNTLTCEPLYLLTMYDDASFYYSFNPSAQSHHDKPAKHRRKKSLLERPSVS